MQLAPGNSILLGTCPLSPFDLLRGSGEQSGKPGFAATKQACWVSLGFGINHRQRDGSGFPAGSKFENKFAHVYVPEGAADLRRP